MFPSSSSTNEPPTDCQYSSNPLLSVAAATAIANHYCSNQNLYRASYCPPPTSYTNQYGPPNHYPHTAYQYPTANQHVTYPPTSPAVAAMAAEANLQRIDSAILASAIKYPQAMKEDPLLRREVEAIAFKYAGTNAPQAPNKKRRINNLAPIINNPTALMKSAAAQQQTKEITNTKAANASARQYAQKQPTIDEFEQAFANGSVDQLYCQQKNIQEFDANAKEKRRLQQSKKQKMEPEEEIEGRVKSFYSSTITINTKAAIASDFLADRYRSDFNSKSKEEEVVLERLVSCYDYQKHKKKEGFDEVVVDGLKCGIESRYMNWYLRLNGRYGKFPFIGNSDDDYLLQFVKNLTHRTKERIAIIQRKRKKHLIAPRSIDDTVLLSAQVFKQLDVNGTEGDPVERAKKGLADLFDILCFDEVDDSQDDPFNLPLDLE